MPYLVGVVLRSETRKEEGMRYRFSKDKLGELKEVNETEDGFMFKFNISPDSARFIEDLFKNTEDDESDDLRASAYDLIENLAALANALAESLKFQIDDGYSITDFVTQSELLCEILDFFKEFKNIDNEE